MRICSYKYTDRELLDLQASINSAQVKAQIDGGVVLLLIGDLLSLRAEVRNMHRELFQKTQILDDLMAKQFPEGK